MDANGYKLLSLSWGRPITQAKPRFSFHTLTTLCSACAIAMLLGLHPGFAQSTAGSIVGTLTDQSGGAVPETTVVLTSVATATTNESITDNSGYYQFVNIPPGNYKITVQKQGFKALTEGPFELQVEGSLRIGLQLQVGSASQTVTVSASSPLVQAETTSLGAVIDTRETTELPLNGRNPMSLAALVPGVVPQGGSQSNPNGQNPFAWGNYQIGGGFANQSATYIDGGPINTTYVNLTALIPTQDSLAEFKVDTNNLTADYGHLAGGAIAFSTKSGTNQLHGALWEYLRNKVLNANTYFANNAGQARPSFTQNQYGFNVGGPVYIPHVYNGRDKTFFFVNWEGFALRQGTTFVETVPTAAELTGNLSGLPGAPVLYDPLTTCTNSAGCAGGLAYGERLPIPGNNLANAPQSSISPTALAYLKAFYPAPNTASSTGVNNFTRNASSGGNNYETVVHIDHNFSEKQHLSARYTYWSNTNLPIDPYGTGICQDRCTEIFSNNDFVLRDSYAISPKTLLDVNLSYMRFVYNRKPSLASFSYASLGSGWAALAPSVQFPGPPVMSIQGFDTDGTFSSQGADSTIINASDNDRIAGNLTRIMGKHTFKFGGEFLRETFNYAQTNISAGDFNFNSGFTSQNANTNVGGAGLASYLLGYAHDGSFIEVIKTAPVKFYPALYVTDEWRVLPKATLHLGLRWEDDYPWTERFNNQSYFDTTAVNPLLSAAGITKYPGSMELVDSSTRSSRRNLNNDAKQFSPRLGLTYAAAQNTVFSVGYGLLWIPQDIGWSSAPNNNPINSFSTPYTASINSFFTPANSINNPVPGGISAAPGRNGFQPILLGTGVTAVFPNNPYAYAQQWNVSIQQQFGSSLALDIAYAGAKGTHLIFGSLALNALPDADLGLGAAALQTQVPNPFAGIINPSYGLGAATVPASQLLLKYPQYSGVNIASDGEANSTYNALQVKVQKRFTGGASIGAGYTLAKLISDTDTVTTWLEPSVATNIVDPNRPSLEKSLSSNDVRNRATIVYVYDVPVGHGRAILADAPRLVDSVVGGWGLEGLTTFQSGYPLGFSVNNNLNSFIGDNQRPNVAAGCARKGTGGAVSRVNMWFNTSCFSQPAQFSFGNEPRNDTQITAPGIGNWDASVFKNVSVDKAERVSVQFRAEFFNLFNRVQFSYPNTSFGASNFGVINSQLNNPRLVQFALRLKF
jgi:Carboxypeptidase regulatory-like domain